MHFSRGTAQTSKYHTLQESELDRIKSSGKQVLAWLIADLHLHHLPAWRYDWCAQFMEDMQTLRQDAAFGKPWFVFMGDVFEIKDRLDSRVADLFMSFACRSDMDTAWITGQHDTYVPGRATLGGLRYSIFLCDDGRSAITDGGKNLLYTVPFARDLAHYREMLDQVPDGALLLTHMPIYEALEQYGPDPDTMIHAKEFKRFKWTYSGDIHQHATYGKLTYIGAPSQRDWRDRGVQGKIGVLYDDLSFERISVEHPVHLKISSQTHIQQLLSKTSIEKQAVYKIVGDISPAQIELIKDIDGVLGVEWVPPELSADRPIEELKIEGLGSDEDLLKDYVETNDVPDGLDREMLLQAGLALCDSKD